MTVDYVLNQTNRVVPGFRAPDPYFAWMRAGAFAMLAMDALVILSPVVFGVLIHRRWKTESKGDLLADSATAVFGVPLLVWTFGHLLNWISPAIAAVALPAVRALGPR